MAASGVYSFQPTIDDIITDAYERCGIDGSDISSQMWTSAMYSFNGVLSETTNMQLNLWEVEPVIIGLKTGVKDYQLPDGTVDIIEVYRRTFTRVLDGTASTSAGGTAANAFDADVTTSCTQTSINGNISYDYGASVTQIISMLGYQSNSTGSFTLIWEGSNDASAWTQLAARGAFSYTKGDIIWEIVRTPAAYRYYRVRESAGGTLAAQEIYFANTERDYVLGRLSRQDYDAISTKTNAGIPVAYYVERSITPMLHLYQTPDSSFTTLRMNRIRQIQSVTGATQTLDSPFRFIEAITSMLAVKLAIKRSPDRIPMLAEAAKLSVSLATSEDRERVTATFIPDMGGYRI